MRFQQGSAATFLFGPITQVDGITPETTLTPVAADILLSKGTSGTIAAKTDATLPVHVGNGFYSVVLNAADLDTAGNLLVSFVDPTLPPVWKSYEVQPTQTYADFYADGATGYSVLTSGDIDTSVANGLTAYGPATPANVDSSLTAYGAATPADLATSLTVGTETIDQWVSKLSVISLGNGADAGDGTASTFSYAVPGGQTYTANFTYTADGSNRNRTLTSVTAT